MEKFVQARSQLDLLIPSSDGPWIPIGIQDRGATGDRHLSTDDEWESDRSDSEESLLAAGEVAEIAGEAGEGFDRQVFHNYD
jgi:hypothetical protein